MAAATAPVLASTKQGHRWKKGQSGNPAGRPKVVSHIRELCRKHTDKALNTLIEIMENKDEKATARVVAAKEILDRGYGKVVYIADESALDKELMSVDEQRKTLGGFITNKKALALVDELVDSIGHDDPSDDD